MSYNSEKYVENQPKANILMPSMRSMGYSFVSAVADVVDNSVSAGASEVQLYFPVDPSDDYVAICDNGKGMSEAELIDAMRYGSGNGGDRDENDLGRFGLGLKSASFSQCRKLTVVSKQHNIVSAYRWDLDVVEETGKWLMVKLDENEINLVPEFDYLSDKENGTVVIWEDFDIIRKSTSSVYTTLTKYEAETADYLSLIFHRYINRKKDKVVFRINNCTLTAKDPFLEEHPRTSRRRDFTVPVPDSKGIERLVKVQPFILPFQKDLSKEDLIKSGGIENYRSEQGFYIYRNERLIVKGTWFGRHKDELTKHARIRVDIPNSLDDVWEVDIKKQSASIPPIIRQRLNNAVDDAMETAIKKQKYRGKIASVNDEIDYIWNRIEQRGGTYDYRINRDSKIFDLIKSEVNDAVWAKIDMVLGSLEASIPYQQIYIDKSQNVISENLDDEQLDEVELQAKMLLEMAKGQNRMEFIEKLFKSEPFCKYSELKNKLLED